MVETVSAQPSAVGQGASVAVVRLEPGTELKARVEANLPGGIVRLATDDAKFDLKLPVRLPLRSDVIISVSGNRSNPVIQVTTPQVLPGEPAPPVTAQQSQLPQQAPPPSQALPVGPAPGKVQAPAASRQAVPTAAQEAPGVQTRQTARVVPQAPAASRQVVSAAAQEAPGAQTRQTARVIPQATAKTQTPVQGLPVQQGADPKGTPVQQGAKPARQPGALAGSASLAPPATGQGAITRAQPDSTVAGARPQPSAGSGSPPPSVAGTPAPLTAPAHGSIGSGIQPTAAAPALGSASTRPQAAPVPARPGAPGTGSPAASAQGPQANLKPAGDVVRQGPLPTQAHPASATISAPLKPGDAVPRPAAPVPQANPVSGALPQSAQQASPQPAVPPPATTGTAPLASPAPAAAGAMPNSSQAPQTPASPVSGPATTQSAVSVRAVAGSPLPGSGKPDPVPAPAPAPVTGAVASAAKPGAVAAGATSAPVHSPSDTATTIPSAQAGSGSQSKGSQLAGESFRVAQNQPYQLSNSAAEHRATANANPNVTSEASPASQLARHAFQALGEQQSGLGNLFAQVGNLMSAQATGKVSLPDPVVKAMQQILGLRLTSGQNLSAGDIQQSIRLSGQFREANAALPRGNTPGAQADLKSVLMSFRSLLQQFGAEAQLTRPAAQPKPPSRQDPPQAQTQPGSRGFLPGTTPQILQAILKETDAALARVRLTQLVNTGLAGDDRAQATSRPMDLVFELPLALGQETGILQLQIGRDGSGQGEEGDNEPAWRLRFAMDLTATGPVEAAVSLRGGGTFVSLWVDRPATFDGLKALEETMLASFADAGLDLQEFRLVRGLPPKAAARYGTLVDRQS